MRQVADRRPTRAILGICRTSGKPDTKADARAVTLVV